MENKTAAHYAKYKDTFKKYNEGRKKIACNVSIDTYESIKLHAEKKGFSSLNSYVLDLIKKDMQL